MASSPLSALLRSDRDDGGHSGEEAVVARKEELEQQIDALKYRRRRCRRNSIGSSCRSCCWNWREPRRSWTNEDRAGACAIGCCCVIPLSFSRYGARSQALRHHGKLAEARQCPRRSIAKQRPVSSRGRLVGLGFRSIRWLAKTNRQESRVSGPLGPPLSRTIPAG